MMEATTRRQLRFLLIKALDGRLDPGQMERLEGLLLNDPEARQRYFELIDVAKALRDASGVAVPRDLGLEDLASVDEGMLQALVELEKTAPTVCQPIIPVVSTPEEIPGKSPRHQDEPSRPNRFWLGVAKLAIAACVGLVLFVWLNPGPPMSTCLVSAVHNAVWDEHSPPLTLGDAVYDQDAPRTLISGVLKLSFDHRTEAIIEGPATFASTKANQLVLQQGKVCAYGPLPDNGFEVLTPYSSVVDLGTEFGVEIDEGGSFVQVFQGEVALKTRVDDARMTAGIAHNVNPHNQQIYGASFETQSFVRYINTQGTFLWKGEALDLTDVVSDGDGFGEGMPSSGISVITGHRGTYQGLGQRLRIRPGYLKVSGNGLVDGVFPVGGERQVISSTGLIWDDCPGVGHLFSEGVIRPGGRYTGAPDSRIPTHAYLLNGISYGYANRQALSVPANTGITFDLQAMRQSLRGIAMESFNTVCGLSESFFKYRSSMQVASLAAHEPCADFYVLLDGRVVFEGRDVTPSQGGIDIHIPLAIKDRFLTLIVTEGQDQQFLYDWALFAEPIIRLQRQ